MYLAVKRNETNVRGDGWITFNEAKELLGRDPMIGDVFTIWGMSAELTWYERRDRTFRYTLLNRVSIV